MANGESGMSGFINTFFEVERLKNQREQLAMLQQNSLAQRTQLAANLASLIADPNARQALSFVVGGDEQLSEDISALLEAVAPGANVLQRIAAMRGLQDMETGEVQNLERTAATQETTGAAPSGVRAEELLQEILAADLSDEERTELGRVMRSRLSGLTPGEVARDVTVADLPRDELAAMERIIGGLDLSEFEKNQISRWAAENNIQWTDLFQRGALGMGQLMLRAQELDRIAAASGTDMPSPNTLLTTMNQTLASLLSNRKAPDEAKQTMVTVFNAAADNLTAMELFPPAPIGRLPTDLSKLNPKMFQGLREFIQNLFGGGPAELDQGMIDEAVQELLEASQEEIEELLNQILSRRDEDNE